MCCLKNSELGVYGLVEERQVLWSTPSSSEDVPFSSAASLCLPLREIGRLRLPCFGLLLVLPDAPRSCS